MNKFAAIEALCNSDVITNWAAAPSQVVFFSISTMFLCDSGYYQTVMEVEGPSSAKVNFGIFTGLDLDLGAFFTAFDGLKDSLYLNNSCRMLYASH